MGSPKDFSGPPGDDVEDNRLADKIDQFFDGFIRLPTGSEEPTESESRNAENISSGPFDLSFLDNILFNESNIKAGSNAGQTPFLSAYQKTQPNLEWVPVGEHRTIQGHHITCGGYYISKEGTKFGAAPFAINESLPVALANEPTTPLNIVEFNYDRLPSTYRRDFLVWLSTEPPHRPMLGPGVGLFAFLILKGIGRWLTHEGANSFYDKDQSQRQGIAMLLQTNAPEMPVHSSLRNEIVCWLNLNQHMSFEEFMAQESTWKYESWWTDLHLAMLASNGMPLQAEQASHIAASLADKHYKNHIQQGTVAEFKRWFDRGYPNGMPIPCTNHPLTVSLESQMLEGDSTPFPKARTTASVTFEHLKQVDRAQLDRLLHQCYFASIQHMERTVGGKVLLRRNVTDLQCFFHLPKNFWSTNLKTWLERLVTMAGKSGVVLTYSSIVSDLFSNVDATNMPIDIDGELLTEFLKRKLNSELNQNGLEAISIDHPLEEESARAIRNDALCVLPILEIETLKPREQRLIEMTKTLLDAAYLPQLRIHRTIDRREKQSQITRWINHLYARNEVHTRLQGMASLYGERTLYRTWGIQDVKVPDSWDQESLDKVYEGLDTLYEDFRASRPNSKALEHWSDLFALKFPKSEAAKAHSDRFGRGLRVNDALPKAQPMAATQTSKATSTPLPSASVLLSETPSAQTVSFALDLKRVQQLQENTQEVDELLSRLFAEPSADADTTENQ